MQEVPIGTGTLQKQRPFNGAEEVYNQYYDTAGNYHWIGTITGEHIVKLVGIAK